MKITYDKQANAAYVKLSSNKIARTSEQGDYYIDGDKEGNIVGIEYLSEPEFEVVEKKKSIEQLLEESNKLYVDINKSLLRAIEDVKRRLK